MSQRYEKRRGKATKSIKQNKQNSQISVYQYGRDWIIMLNSLAEGC